MLKHIFRRRRCDRTAKRAGLIADNRGFSLIELIIGVLILSIIVAPLLHSMVTSAQLSQKSREMRDATLAAENVVEAVLSDGLDSFITGYSLSGRIGLSELNVDGAGNAEAKLYYLTETGTYEPCDAQDITTGDRDNIYYIGITGITTPGGTYDAMVELNATQYREINENYISVYTGMDGAFSQPSDVNENPDLIAAAYFAELASQQSGRTVKADEFTYSMDRVVTLTIDKVPDGSGLTTGVYILTTEITYSASYNGIELDPLDPWSLEFYRFMYDETEVVDLGAIFFFYYPNYGKGDTIEIKNLSGVDFSLFIVKQKADIISLESLDDTYKATLNLYEPYVGGGATLHCSICTNIATNLVKNTVIPLYTDGLTVNLCATYNGQTLLNGIRSILNSLVYTEKRNRIYNVTVSLYEAGKSFNSDAKITEFESSQVE